MLFGPQHCFQPLQVERRGLSTCILRRNRRIQVKGSFFSAVEANRSA
jgi:hypothetical protein